MLQHLLTNLHTNTRLLPFLAFAALVLAVLAMIMSRFGQSSKDVSRRTAMAQDQAGKGQASGQTGGKTDYQIRSAAYGFSIAELQYISRIMEKLGVAPERSVLVFTALRLTLAALGGGAGYFASQNMTWPLPLYGAAGGVAAAWFIPMTIIKSWIRNYNKQVIKGLPDAIELLAICIDAGVSLESALDRVSRETRITQPALSQELSLTWAQMAILPDRDQALMNLAARVNSQSLRSVIGTLSQSLRFGTPLSQSLRTAAEEMRNEQILRIEERANRLPALLTLPVMCLILPTIFLVVGGPAAIKVIDAFSVTSLPR